jgi:hypothetical protein
MTALKKEDEPRKEVLLEDEQAEDKNPGGEPYQILPAPDDFLPVPDVSLSAPDSCLPAHEDRRAQDESGEDE